MENEQVSREALALVFQAFEFGDDVLKAAVKKCIKHMQNSLKKQELSDNSKGGRRSLTWMKNIGNIESIPIKKCNLPLFERCARKHHILYAVQRDSSTTPPTYIVKFKGAKAGTLSKALNEYVISLAQKTKKPSVLAILKQLKELGVRSTRKVKDRVIQR